MVRGRSSRFSGRPGGGWLLDFSFAAAAILGAALASTDPVLLRGVLKGEFLTAPVRQTLRLESGLNDAVLLPVVLIGMVFLDDRSLGESDWGSFGLSLFLLGPVAGMAVGFLAVSALVMMRNRFGVRRDYESIYSLEVVFAGGHPRCPDGTILSREQ